MLDSVSYRYFEGLKVCGMVPLCPLPSAGSSRAPGTSRGDVGQVALLLDARDEHPPVVGIARDRLGHVLPGRWLVGTRSFGRGDEMDLPCGLEEVEIELLPVQHLETVQVEWH